MTPEEIASLLLSKYRQPDFPDVLEQISPQLTEDVLFALVQLVHAEQFHNPQQALGHLEIVEGVVKILGTEKAIGLALNLQGNILLTLCHYQEALNCYKRAEAIFHSLGGGLAVACLLVNQVMVLRDLGEYPMALALDAKARAACEVIGGETAERYLANLDTSVGWIYEEMGQWEKAMATYILNPRN